MSDAKPSDDAIQSLLLECYRREGRGLRRLAYGFVRCWETARELCQEAFAKAWEKRHGFDDWQALENWMTQVVVRDSLRYMRRKRQEMRSMQAKMKDAAAICELQTGVDNFEAAMHALDQLPESYRAVVALRCMRGLDNKQASSLLGLTYGQASKRYRRGIELMRKSFFEYEEPGGGTPSPGEPEKGREP